MPNWYNIIQVDDRSNKEMKLSIIWKHVTKEVETFPSKMAELIIIDNHFRI